MTTVVSVRFRNGTKNYYFAPGPLNVAAGQDVIVETAQGLEFAHCTEGNHEVDDAAVVQPLRAVVRIATENDYRTDAYNRTREKEAFDICQKKILQHGLEMKLVRVECSFDGSKFLFFFTADGRVDFRELVKDLAGVFRSRIELRQIGVRDEAKMLGGLGICGKPFCCSLYMDDFVPVSIKMAKTQNLSLNPTKISGTCGRLMCCLNYEQWAYEEALKELPKAESFVLTPDGTGNVVDVNVLKETVNVKLDDRVESPRCYHNCEVCVLRSGKGSREGVEIPSKRPERYVEKREEEAIEEIPVAFGEKWVKTPAPEEVLPAENEGRRRRSHRGGRRGRGGAETARRSEQEKPEKKESIGQRKKEAEAPKENRHHINSHRSEKNGAAGEKTPVQALSSAADAPQKPKNSGSRHRSHYRRGGRRGKPQGGEKS